MACSSVSRQVLGLGHPLARVGDQRDQRPRILDRPVPAGEAGAGFRRVLRGADQRDDLVDVGDGDGEAGERMGARAGLGEQMGRAPGDDLLAEVDEGRDDVPKIHHLRPAAAQRQHVHAEAGLQRRVAVELVEHHLGHGAAPELDDDAHAVAVGFVAQVGDPLDAALVHQGGDALDHPRLVDLVGDLRDDDRLAVLAGLLDVGAAAHDHRAAPGVVGLADAGGADDHGPGREVRPRHVFHQAVDRDLRVVDRDLRVVEIGAGRVHDLAQIVRRDVGRHADRDAARAVDQKVGEGGRQHHRLVRGLVVVGLEVDRLLVDVGQQRVRRLAQADLGVAHRRRRVAVHRAVVPLPVQQRQAHGELLRHAHHGVVDRGVAVGVILAHHVADHTGRLAIGLVPVVAALVHREEDAAMHGLQPVAHVGQRTADDHAHRVIEVGAFHLLLDGDGGRRGRVAAGRLARWRGRRCVCHQ